MLCPPDKWARRRNERLRCETPAVLPPIRLGAAPPHQLGSTKKIGDEEDEAREARRRKADCLDTLTTVFCEAAYHEGVASTFMALETSNGWEAA